ncbi:MAG: bifunctional hydroxymethylpyrimidine kinase/phosphomethylpyrimidine kinase [Alphaproteobacteria bacterium]|nr:bifunctional hydroxymethylpyrimidine kinase/phosphomethylpyrimidine kinase [Alphaproteobacteria bacterium]MBV9372958.1 bifunctional hydroxymethylpyrimidine kinase/phosphomethylpyrimidine kinase [Alphaproteobacteria bacterium]MBV9901325.1 bifunctional hydroxymethylpyrimidine kinase/phosphomethylpyrimidine kinase [Alphaproteobacteria bacterium]
MKPPRVLVIAGSDSGGGAGIQADIKTIAALGGFATTAVTALTAQNTLGVAGVMAVPAPFVLAQVDSVISDLGADAIKIGMIGSAATASALAERLPRNVPIVFDPVMVATSGAALADGETIAAFERLMGLAAVVTPNLPELEALAGRSLGSAAAAEGAARDLALRTKAVVLAKGGHGEGAVVTDMLVSPHGLVRRWEGARIDTPHTHGTGCTLASAIAVHLGRGRTLADAVERARGFVRRAMLAAPGFGAGHGPMGHAEAGTDEMNLDQVTLPARDYEASVGFYRTLGLTQIVDSPGRYARFECPGGATLSIHVEEGLEAGGATIGFESADLDAWVERLQAAGLAFESLPRDERWQWREAHLRDPAGNRIMLFRAGENRRFPPWRIG